MRFLQELEVQVSGPMPYFMKGRGCSMRRGVENPSSCKMFYLMMCLSLSHSCLKSGDDKFNKSLILTFIFFMSLSASSVQGKSVKNLHDTNSPHVIRKRNGKPFFLIIPFRLVADPFSIPPFTHDYIAKLEVENTV